MFMINFAKVKTASYICKKINVNKDQWEKLSADARHLTAWRHYC